MVDFYGTLLLTLTEDAIIQRRELADNEPAWH